MYVNTERDCCIKSAKREYHNLNTFFIVVNNTNCLNVVLSNAHNIQSSVATIVAALKFKNMCREIEREIER